jgi:hypothetical protein
MMKLEKPVFLGVEVLVFLQELNGDSLQREYGLGI